MPPENCLNAGRIVRFVKYGSRSSVSPKASLTSVTNLLAFDERELNLVVVSDEVESVDKVSWISRFEANVCVFPPSSP